jgi:hypothetical protein
MGMALMDDLARDTDAPARDDDDDGARGDPVKSRCWLCCTCGDVRRSPMPATVAAPCARCNGLDFETVPHGTVLH